jgi:hypothetical protein
MLTVIQEEAEELRENWLFNTQLKDPNNYLDEKYSITPLGRYAVLIKVSTSNHFRAAGFVDSNNSAFVEPVLCRRTISGYGSGLAMSPRVTGAMTGHPSRAVR